MLPEKNLICNCGGDNSVSQTHKFYCPKGVAAARDKEWAKWILEGNHISIIQAEHSPEMLITIQLPVADFVALKNL